MLDECNDHESVVKHLEHVYKKIGSGFGADHAEGTHDSSNLGYGEVTYAGMESVYESLCLDPSDTFYDLGSGTGKLVLYVALRGKGAMSKGLEIGERRHGLAETACKLLSAELEAQESGDPTKLARLPQRCTGFEVHLADITKQRYVDASVVVINSVCLDMKVQARTLDCLLRGPMKRLICTTAMPPNKRLKLKKTMRVPCTWAKVVCWHVYDVLSNAKAAEPPRPVEAAAYRRRVKLPLAGVPAKAPTAYSSHKQSLPEAPAVGEENRNVEPSTSPDEMKPARSNASSSSLHRSSASGGSTGASPSAWR